MRSALPQLYSACCGLASLTLRAAAKSPSLTHRFGNSSKVCQREGVDVRVLGLAEAAELLVEHDDLHGVAGRRQVRPVGARGPGDVVRREQDDGLLGRHGLSLGVEADVAEDDLVAPADAVRDHAGLRPVGQDLPDVVTVVDEDRGVAVRPAARAVGAGLAGRVLGLVDEADAELGRQVERLAVQDAVGVVVSVGVVEPEQVLPAGRDRARRRGSSRGPSCASRRPG